MKEEKNTYFKSKDTSIFSIKQMINFQNRYFHIIECELNYDELLKKLLCEEYFKYMFPKKDYNEFLDICRYLLTLGNEYSNNLFYKYLSEENPITIFGNIGEILTIFCFNNITYNNYPIKHAKLCYDFFNIKQSSKLLDSHPGADYIGIANDKYILLDVKTISSQNSSFVNNKKTYLKELYSKSKYLNLKDVIIAEIGNSEQILDIKNNNTILGFFVFQKKSFTNKSINDILTNICFCKDFLNHEINNLCNEFKEGVLFHFKINSFEEVVNGFEKFFLGDNHVKK